MASPVPPRIVPITGPPGAGKSSTLIELAHRHQELVRFGVRDYGLHLAGLGHPLGLAMRETLLRQELLTDELVRAEFRHFLDHVPDTATVAAVEGYPRDLRQCDDLLEMLGERGTTVAGFVVMDIPDALVRERVGGRRICRRCGAPAASPAAPRCGDCAGPLTRRRDDETVHLERRLADFRHVSTGPRTYFAARGLLREVDASRSAERVRGALAGVLGLDERTTAVDVPELSIGGRGR